ncbi:hypothetical protein AVEN_94732-1 [Araneus ventricosus]|uniref:Reverse transcriptase domain-containing protein n=1 Tax=Araneus ventricosus TaxID=182803 RepID=A0A4Y2CLY9_ARAVE|nr:hypothetical protein AVEN_94732-1 [Araneus ventricosus]
MVFDASSKGKGHKSLNDCLNPSPPLNTRLHDILLRFREFEYSFCSDIQGAAFRIGMAEEVIGYLRFFWFPDKQDLKSYKILRMTRVPFGVTSSPFVLAATIKYHIRKYKQERREDYEMLNSSFYVDDLFYCANTVNEALDLSISAVENSQKYEPEFAKI